MATWSVKVMNFIDCFKQIFQECIVKSGSFVLYPAYFYSWEKSTLNIKLKHKTTIPTKNMRWLIR